MIEVMKKGTITRSLLNNIGNFNASRNDKVITDTYKDIPTVPIKKKNNNIDNI